MDPECNAEQTTHTQLSSSGRKLFPFVCRGSQQMVAEINGQHCRFSAVI